MSSSAFLFAPYESIPSKNDPNRKLAYKRWQKALGEVIHYQSGYQRVPMAGRAGIEGYLCNRGAIDDFSHGNNPGDSLGRLLELWDAFPGEYLAVWTYGHTVHVLFLSSRSEEPMREVSFRLVSHPGGRDPSLVEGFCRWFPGLAVRPDVEQLRLQLSAPEISVEAWFRAFGIEGARNMTSGTDDIWLVFENASLVLLQGHPLEEDVRLKINAHISDKSEHIKRKPLKEPGQTARHVHAVAWELAEALGEPKAAPWGQRYRAARFYWDITDCEDACNQLTVGIDDAGLGTSASLGRLLGHYPVELLRDPIFLAFAGMECEGANGHAFVEAFHVLAEAADKAGFSIAVFPKALQSKFRKDFGIESEWEESSSGSEDSWAAEAFVDLPELLTADPIEKIQDWYSKEKGDGLLARGEPDGSFWVTYFREGQKVDRTLAGFAEPDGEQISRSAVALNPRGVFQGLGLPDLLEPGEWQEGIYDGQNVDRSKERSSVEKDLAELPPPVAIGSFKEFLKLFPSNFRNKDSEKPLAMKITLPGCDSKSRDLLMEDLKGKGLLESYGESWPLGSEALWAFTYSDITTPLLVRVLGDVPEGATVALDMGSGQKTQYRLDNSLTAPSQRFQSCVDPRSAGDSSSGFLFRGIDVDHPAVEEIVWEKEDRTYLGLDVTKLGEGKAESTSQAVKELKAFGFTHLGDLVCSQFDGIAIRAFADETHGTYGSVLLPTSGHNYTEFVTYFSDGGSLTTTSYSEAKAKPEQKKHVRVISDSKGGTSVGPESEESITGRLWNAHLEGIERFARDGIVPKPVDPTLIGIAKAIDAYIEAERKAGNLFAFGDLDDAFDGEEDDDD